MKISVVIATYKCEQFIEQQLDSICRQTRKADEIIISDDRSPDRTLEVVKNYIEQNQITNVKVVQNSENKGHFFNFLGALELVTGEIICFSDQDDVWNLNKLAHVESFFLAHPGASCLETGTETFQGDFSKDIATCQEGKSKCKSVAQVLTKWGSGYQMAFRSDVIEMVLQQKLYELPGFDYHDVLLAYFALCKGPYWLDSTVLNYHRLHTNNVTLRSDYKILRDTPEKRRELIERHNTRITSLQEYKGTPQTVRKVCASTIKLNKKRLCFLQGAWKNLLYMMTHLPYYHSVRVFLADIYCQFFGRD